MLHCLIDEDKNSRNRVKSGNGTFSVSCQGCRKVFTVTEEPCDSGTTCLSCASRRDGINSEIPSGHALSSAGIMYQSGQNPIHRSRNSTQPSTTTVTSNRQRNSAHCAGGHLNHLNAAVGVCATTPTAFKCQPGHLVVELASPFMMVISSHFKNHSKHHSNRNLFRPCSGGVGNH